jgi:4-aminobutyrate--pyruvate transaminase
MLVVAKAFSGGYLPISALLIRDEIYREIARFSAENGVLGHGFTYTAHPVPAAVALETMNIFAERDIVGHVQRVQGAFWQALAPVRDSPIVGELRGLGLIAGIELVADRTSKRPFAAEAGATRVLESHCLAEGLILRAIGNTMVAAPPLIITEAGIDELAGKLLRALRKTEDQLLAGARSTHAMPG